MTHRYDGERRVSRTLTAHHGRQWKSRGSSWGARGFHCLNVWYVNLANPCASHHLQFRVAVVFNFFPELLLLRFLKIFETLTCNSRSDIDNHDCRGVQAKLEAPNSPNMPGPASQEPLKVNCKSWAGVRCLWEQIAVFLGPSNEQHTSCLGQHPTY